MFVNVQYYRDETDSYGGRLYTYETHLPLRPMDKVIAPTAKNARQRACVLDVNVAKPAFPCKEISEMYRGDAEKELEDDFFSM